MTVDPADLNQDGVVTQQEQVTYDILQKDNGSAPEKSKEDYPVLWSRGVTGTPDLVGGGTRGDRKTKTEAKAAYTTGGLTAYQKKILDNGYAKYKASGGRSGKKGWWSDYVDAAADTNETPFDIVFGQYGSDADKYTSDDDTGSGKDRTSVAISTYTPELANQILDAAVTATFGTGTVLTKTQRDSFYGQLTAGQRKGTTTTYKTKGGKRYATTTKSFDEDVFRKKYIGTILESMVTGNDDIDLEGDAGVYQDTLLKYSDDMGLMKGRRELNGYVKEIIGKGRSVEDVTADMRKQAGVLYSNFADRLNADPKLTVRDLVNPYLQVMADTLEIDPNTVKLTDTTIQNAISGTKLRSLSDFQADMRADSRFGNTKVAKREAVDLAQSLLRSFGFGA